MTHLNKIIKQYDTSLRFMVGKLAKLTREEEYEACLVYKSEIDKYVIRQCKILIANDHKIIYPEGESLYSAVLDLLGYYYILAQRVLFNNIILEREDIDRSDINIFCSPLLKEVNDFYENELIEIDL